MIRHAWLLLLPFVIIGPARANEAVSAGQPLALAIKKKVQDELKLKPEQVEAIQKLYETASKDETSFKLETLTRELEPAQLRRLKEISLQVLGGAALAHPAVQKELSLSAKQIAAINDIWKNEEENLRQVLRVARFRNAAVRRKFILEHRQGAGKKLLEQLGDEQQAELKKLQGKPIDLKGLDH
jgi:hypothetical protein